MKWIKLTTVMLLGITSWTGKVTAQEDKHQAPRTFMRQKLEHTRGILEGLTLENYGLILSNAISVRSMTLTNTFVILGNPEFRAEVTNFQFKLDALVAAAKAKDLSRSTAAYQRVIENCVSCHQQFRRDQFISGQQKTK